LIATLVIVIVIGTIVGLHKTDVHLTARLQDAAEIGGPRLTAHVDGRDAYLGGRGTERDVAHALSLASGIPGLRTINIEAQVVAARTELDVDASAVEPSVTVVFDGGRITLRGLVADDGSHAAILSAAAKAVGADRVRDRLRETRTAKPAEWLQQVPQAIEVVAGLPAVTLAFGEDRVLVTGSVATDEIRTRVAAALDATGIAVVVDSLAVAEPESPWLHVERTGDRIVLRGLVGRDQLETVLVALETTYGFGASSRDEVVLSSNSARVDWPRLVAAVIPTTYALDPWTVSVDKRGLMLFGATSDAFAPARVATVVDRLDVEGSIQTDVRLAPTAIVGELSAAAKRLDWFGGGGDLTPQATAALDDIAVKLLENQDVAIVVIGHPGGRTDIAADRENGLLRAVAVRSYLVQRGIDPARIEAEGHPTPVHVDGEPPVFAIDFVLAGGRSRP